MQPYNEPHSLTRILRSRFVTAIGLAALMTLPGLAQDKDKDKHKDHQKDEKKGAQSGQPNESEMMAMMMEMAKPGDNHKLLSDTVGEWTYKVKAWMSPDPNAAPQESSGTSVTREVMGGRYFVTDHSGKFQIPGGPDGKMIDMEFKGMAVEGYDNAKKKFVASWIDNMGTGIMALQGDYDPASKSFTYHAEYEMAPGTKTKVREVIKLIDKDHRVFEWYEDRGGSEAKTMEMTYTRKS
jgi:hypothetical protein